MPTHRGLHSPHGGLFQPTIPQAIRLLSSPPFVTPRPQTARFTTGEAEAEAEADYSDDIPDPFTTGSGLTFTTTGADQHPVPWAFPQRTRHAWVHIFPEACVHQHPQLAMRYFKWGVSRLILESEPAPDVVPVFIDGTQRAMPEDRGFPRFLPRAGVRPIRVAFGEMVDVERAFGDLRERWRELVARSRRVGADVGAAGGKTAERTTETLVGESKALVKVMALGDLTDDDELRYGREAVEIRVECARRVRAEVAKLRRSLGYPDEEPSFELAETWAREPPNEKFKSNVDDSLVNKRK